MGGRRGAGEGSLDKQRLSNQWQKRELVPLYVHIEQVHHLCSKPVHAREHDHGERRGFHRLTMIGP